MAAIPETLLKSNGLAKCGMSIKFQPTSLAGFCGHTHKTKSGAENVLIVTSLVDVAMLFCVIKLFNSQE